MGYRVMRVRLDEETLLAVLAWDDLAWKAEGVEATTHPPEASMLSPRHCRICDKVKSGSEFYPSNPTYCKPCTTAKINAHIQGINDRTRTTAEHHREPWSELEVEMLLAAVGEGMHVRDIAEMLGRTYLAVHGKLRAVRALIAEGRAVEIATFTIHQETTTKITITRENVCPVCHLVLPCFCD